MTAAITPRTLCVSLTVATFCFGDVAGSSTARADVLTYIGSTPNWFAPSNWDGGRVPGAGDDVIIGGGRTVVIDPALGSPNVTFRDLTVADGSSLETLAGTEYSSRNETISHGSRLIHRSTHAIDNGSTGTAIYTDNCGVSDPCGYGVGGGLFLNPTRMRRGRVLGDDRLCLSAPIIAHHPRTAGTRDSGGVGALRSRGSHR